MRAASWTVQRFQDAGFEVKRHEFQTSGRTCINIEASVPGSQFPDEIVIIGAHYDSLLETVGADDNASGVAALLAIAESLQGTKPARTLRFVAFANEEPPFFQTSQMGSLVYALACKDRGERIVAMISFDGLGFYTDKPHSQTHPFPLNFIYPHTGDFVAFISNFGSRDLLKQCVASFRAHAEFPSTGGAAPQVIPGVGWSDHWSFWQAGYPAIMVTDTLPYRYQHYHTQHDTPDKLDYEKMARVVEGLMAVTKKLAKIE